MSSKKHAKEIKELPKQLYTAGEREELIKVYLAHIEQYKELYAQNAARNGYANPVGTLMQRLEAINNNKTLWVS